MNRFEKVILAMTLALTLLRARMLVVVADAYADTRPISAMGWAIGIAGYLVAAYGPVVLAICCWRWAKRARRPWILHLLFLPGAIALLNLGLSMILYVIGDPDFDSMMGGASIPAMLVFLVAVGGYFGALMLRTIARSAPSA